MSFNAASPPARRPTSRIGPRRRRSLAFWRVEENLDGWISYVRDCSPRNDKHPLAVHADWAGPVKLIESADDRKLQVRFDFHLAASLGHGPSPALDPDLAAETEALQDAFAAQVQSFDEATHIGGWSPPPVAALADWLVEAGFQPTEDDEHNLRLSIRRRGATGQWKAVRAPGRLRFSMSLGRWSDLLSENRRAMQKLASLANARCRLARVVWESENNVDACRVCVDLSGLPYHERGGRRRENFWADMTRLAMTALELAVSQLAQELAVLAEDGQQELVRSMPC